MELGISEAWTQSLNLDAGAPEFGLQGQRESVQICLGGAVGGIARHGEESGQGRDVDDRAAAPGDHSRQGGAGKPDGGDDVNLDHGQRFTHIDLGELVGLPQPGVVA